MKLRSHDDADDDHVRRTIDEAEDDAVEEFFTRCPRLTPPRGRGRTRAARDRDGSPSRAARPSRARCATPHPTATATATASRFSHGADDGIDYDVVRVKAFAVTPPGFSPPTSRCRYRSASSEDDNDENESPKDELRRIKRRGAERAERLLHSVSPVRLSRKRQALEQVEEIRRRQDKVIDDMGVLLAKMHSLKVASSRSSQ
jgi:hypothetical protein